MPSLITRFRDGLARRRRRAITPEAAWQRAARGAAYLDEVDPGWYRQVDVRTMELGDASCCVLGQLHGDFRIGLSRSRLLSMGSAPRANLSPVHFGFLCVSHPDPAWQEQDYRYLNRAWQQEVWHRQEGPAWPLSEEPVADPERAAVPA